jgi:hypothetical protein
MLWPGPMAHPTGTASCEIDRATGTLACALRVDVTILCTQPGMTQTRRDRVPSAAAPAKEIP